MNRFFTSGRSGRVALAAVIALSVAQGCGDLSAPASVGGAGPRVREARVTSSSDMSVTSTSPDSATQDTTLDVVISGSGFVAGTQAVWALAGVADSTQVRTNRTTYVSSKKLIANITISASATIGKWDVAVAASGKKGGIGTEMFAIKSNSKPVPSAAPDFYVANDAGLALRGDGAASYLETAGTFIGTSKYSDVVCGVSATLWNSPDDHGSGDATLWPNFTKDRRCSSYPRALRISHLRITANGSVTDEGTVKEASGINVAQIESAPNNQYGLIYIPVGSSELRPMNIGDADGACATLRMRPVLRDGRVTGADQVSVARMAADTWVVSSLPDEIDPITGATIHHDKAWCETTGAFYHMPVRFTIHTKTPITP